MLLNLFISAGYITVDGLERSKGQCVQLQKTESWLEQPERPVFSMSSNAAPIPLHWVDVINSLLATALLMHILKKRMREEYLIQYYSQSTVFFNCNQSQFFLIMMMIRIWFDSRRSRTLTGFMIVQQAGIIAAVRPCGIIVNFMEMCTCESLT